MSNRVKYELSGGSSVEVFKIFGNEFYFAIADQNGIYPEKGKIAKDVGRDEYVLVISGELTFTVNGVDHVLKENDSLLIKDGDTYTLNGKGKAIVFVRDSEGGKTDIIDA